MSIIKARRFWTDVTVKPCHQGWQVLLDDRALKTPAKQELILPTEGFATAVADEWAGIDAEVDPLNLPHTRMANVAVDRLADDPGPVVEMLAEYGATDLLCYRATGPVALSEHQSAAWDPVLTWAQQTFGARLAVTSGVMHVAQDRDDLDKLRAPISDMTAFQLAGFHDLVKISGSLVLGLAAAHCFLSADEAFALSRIDEHWQEEQWGRDEDAHAAEVLKAAEFAHAHRVFHIS